MSDCHGICFLIIDSGVSVGTNAWEACVYSISGGGGGEMVLTGCISKSGCCSDNHYKAVYTGVMGMTEMGKVNIFLSLDCIYSSVSSP